MEIRDHNANPENIRHTNIPVIDESHNKLLEIHNLIKSLTQKNASKNDLAEIFFTLSNFFENHLIREELYLKSKGYSNLENHKNSHLAFIKEIERLKDNYGNDIHSSLKQLDTFIGVWLQTHLSNYNKELVDLLNQQK